MADERKFQRTAHVPGIRGRRETGYMSKTERVLRDLARERPDLAPALQVHIEDAAAQRRVRQFETPVTARSGPFAGITFESRADLAQTRRDEARAQQLWRSGRTKEAKVIGRTLLRKMYLLTGDRDNWAWLLGTWNGS